MESKFFKKIMLCLFCVFLFCSKTKAATSMGWDERYIEKYKDKQATYTVCYSFDKTECWIRQIKLYPKKRDVSVLKIPKKIKGAIVTKIGYPNHEKNYYSDIVVNVFGSMYGEECEEFQPNNQSVREILLPDTLEDILPACFGGLINLQRVDLPKNLKEIKNWVFTGCSKLKQLKIPSKTEIIWDGAFAGCDTLQKITISKKNKTFKAKNGVILSNNGTRAYMISPKTREIRIPKGVKTISKQFYVFGSQSIYIPASVVSIEGGSLNNAAGKLKITISSQNKTYGISGGCIYDKKTGDLVYGASINGVLNIPKQVKRLVPDISWGGKAKKIVIPGSVKYMERDWCMISHDLRTKVVFKGTKPPRTQIKERQINNFVPELSKIQVPKKSFYIYKRWLEEANIASELFLNGKRL